MRLDARDCATSQGQGPHRKTSPDLEKMAALGSGRCGHRPWWSSVSMESTTGLYEAQQSFVCHWRRQGWPRATMEGGWSGSENWEVSGARFDARLREIKGQKNEASIRIRNGGRGDRGPSGAAEFVAGDGGYDGALGARGARLRGEKRGLWWESNEEDGGVFIGGQGGAGNDG